MREKIQQLIQLSPGTTNISELEIYDGAPQTNSFDRIRKDAVRLVYHDEGGFGAERFMVQVFHLPAENRFYIQSIGRSPSRYYGPFKGDPFQVLAPAKERQPFNPASGLAGAARTNPAAVEPDNPLGLDDTTIIRLFEAGRVLERVAKQTSMWAASHHLRVPSSIEEIYAHFLNRDEMGNDPFGAGKLQLETVQNKIRVSSVGPDGQEDGGKQVAIDDPFLKGDLSVEIPIGQQEIRWLAEGALLDYLQGKHTARYLAKKSTHYQRSLSVPAQTTNNLRFGPVVDGLSAAVELLPANGHFVLDQPVGLRFHIRNESDYEIQVAGSSWREADRLILENEKGEPAKNDQGRPIMMGSISYSGISSIQREILKPGQSTIFRSSALEFLSPNGRAKHPVGYTAKVKPDRYIVRFELYFRGWGAELMDWKGELETGPVTVDITSGTASQAESPAALSESEPLAYFSGRVLDDETGKPITNFWVQLGGTSREQTNKFIWWSGFQGATHLRAENLDRDAGAFWANTYQGYPGGIVWARVLADGYLPQSVTPEPSVCPFRIENLQVRLKLGREIRGRILDSGGRPLAGARVFLAGMEGISETQQLQWFKATTALSDQEGHFVLRGAGVGGQRVTAFSAEGLAAEPMAVPEPGKELEIRFP